jgi:hypothetical protein
LLWAFFDYYAYFCSSYTATARYIDNKLDKIWVGRLFSYQYLVTLLPIHLSA